MHAKRAALAPAPAKPPLRRMAAGPSSPPLSPPLLLSATWLALDALPVSSALAYETAPQRAALPYQLLARLAGTSGLYRQAGFTPTPGLTGPFDGIAARQPSLRPAIETKILKVGSGDTIMGMLQDAGVTNQDAAGVVDAIKPLYSPRNLHSGQTFQAIFANSPTAHSASQTPDTDASDDQDQSPVRRLVSLSFSPSVDHQIMVQLTGPDGYLAQDVPEKARSALSARGRHHRFKPLSRGNAGRDSRRRRGRDDPYVFL